MAKQPFISVILPVYNGEKFIRPCIEQILEQTYKNIEIIAIDDGSKDNSAQIIQEYPVRFVPFKKNKGLSAARNAGFDLAQGKYIHYMDIDDEINSSFYEKLAEAVQETEADIACSGMINEKKPHRTILFEKQKTITSTEKKLKITNVGKWGYVWRFLFKKSFLAEHKLRFEEGKFIEDLPFTLPAMFYSKKLVTVPDAEYFYKFYEESIMNKKDKAHRKKRKKDLQYVKKFRHDFANEHHIKIPGIPTQGILSYYFVKYLK